MVRNRNTGQNAPLAPSASHRASRLPSGSFIPQTYGDNVSDFNPSFYTYGSAGGLIPHITVDYRFLSVVDPTNPSPGVNGPSNAGGQTLKIVQDANSLLGWLWQASPVPDCCYGGAVLP